MRPSWSIFIRKNLPSDRRYHLGWESFIELFLSNIMKYGKNNIESQTIKQGMSLSDFGDIWGKEKEALR